VGLSKFIAKKNCLFQPQVFVQGLRVVFVAFHVLFVLLQAYFLAD
jgi:hypothetical protein